MGRRGGGLGGREKEITSRFIRSSAPAGFLQAVRGAWLFFLCKCNGNDFFFSRLFSAPGPPVERGSEKAFRSSASVRAAGTSPAGKRSGHTFLAGPEPDPARAAPHAMLTSLALPKAHMASFTGEAPRFILGPRILGWKKTEDLPARA